MNEKSTPGEPQPLLLRPGTTEIFHPSGRNGIITLNVNEQIELYCSKGFASPSRSEKTIIATCTSGNLFSYNNLDYEFKSFFCTAFTAHAAQKSGARCFNNGYIIEHGFPVESRFVKVFESCHDEVTEENYYSYYKFTPANDGFQTGR